MQIYNKVSSGTGIKPSARIKGSFFRFSGLKKFPFLLFKALKTYVFRGLLETPARLQRERNILICCISRNYNSKLKSQSQFTDFLTLLLFFETVIQIAA